MRAKNLTPQQPHHSNRHVRQGQTDTGVDRSKEARTCRVKVSVAMHGLFR